MINYPKITIVTLVRNAAATLEKAIQSLITQDYPNLEYIIVDAVSTDGTVDIIKKYAWFVSFWRSYKDGGTGDAHNDGIERATGEIIAFLNGDDWYEEGTLRKVGETFSADPTLEMVTCQARVVHNDEKGQMVETKRFQGKSLELNCNCSMVPNARFYKLGLFDKYGKVIVKDDEGNTIVANDIEMIFKFAINGVKNKVIDHLGYTYFEHSDSLTFGNNTNIIRKLYRDRVFISEKFLLSGEKIPPEGIKRLKRWHKRGTARLFLWNMAKDGDRKKAAEALRHGLKISPITWIPYTLRLSLFGKRDS